MKSFLRFSPLLVSRRAFQTSLNNLEHLRVEKKENSVWVTINRPSVKNAFNEQVISELSQTFRILGSEANETSEFRAIVLTGEGDAFSAGADLAWMRRMSEYSFDENRKDAEQLFDMFDAIKRNPFPVIGRVNGAALGGGAGLVSACDFSLAVSSAKIGFTEVKLGLIPAVISSFVLDKISNGSASRYFLTGEIFDGNEAERIGLVQHTYADVTQLDAALAKVLSQLDTCGPYAVRSAKTLISQVSSKKYLADIKKYTTEQIATIRATPEGREGIQSFLDKKKPAWNNKK